MAARLDPCPKPRTAAETYDRFQAAYVELAQTLRAAREYVQLATWQNEANPEAEKLLRRIDDALEMRANLEERT